MCKLFIFTQMDLTFIKSPPVLRGPDSCRKACKEILGKYSLSLRTKLIRILFLLKIENSWILVPSRERWLLWCLWCLCFFPEDTETQGGHRWPGLKAQVLLCFQLVSCSTHLHGSGCQGQTCSCTDRTLVNVPGPQQVGPVWGRASALPVS